MIFQNLKQLASKYLGKEAKDAVIAVPAYFNFFQKETIKYSLIVAGFNCLKIIDECSAIALFYYLKNICWDKKYILIFDLGAGSLSVAIAHLYKDDGDNYIEMKSMNGNLHLGGEDFDNKLLEYCCQEIKKKTNINIELNLKAMSRLRKYCEKAKIVLSSCNEVSIDIESLANGHDFHLIITRNKFEDLCSELFKKCLLPLENVIKDSKISRYDINEVILVGGSSRIPKIQQMLKDFFGKEMNNSINKDEAIAYGAAIFGAFMTKYENKKLKNMCLLSIINPLSLWAEVNGVMDIFIPKNSTFLDLQSQYFWTNIDYQTSFFLKIYEGESLFANNNKLLFSFNVDEISPCPRGQASIELNPSLDKNSELKIITINNCNNSKKEIIIKDERRTKEDIENWLNEAKKLKAIDNKIEECLKYKNNLEQYCYCIKQAIIDIKPKEYFSDFSKKQLENIAVAYINWINEKNNATKDDYEQKLNEIKFLFNQIMESIKIHPIKRNLLLPDELKVFKDKNLISKNDNEDPLQQLNLKQNKNNDIKKIVNKFKINITNKENDDKKINKKNNNNKEIPLNKKSENKNLNKEQKKLKVDKKNDNIIKDERQINKERIKIKKYLKESCDKALKIINDNKIKYDKKINEISKWIDNHSNALIEEFEEKNKEIENILNENETTINIETIKELKRKIETMKKENQNLKNYINNPKLKDSKNFNNKKNKFEISECNFSLISEEKYMTIIFVSNDQNIYYSIQCKKKDKFNEIEGLLYYRYPDYRRSNNYFSCKGKYIFRNKTLEQNGINNNDIIILKT